MKYDATLKLKGTYCYAMHHLTNFLVQLLLLIN